MADKQKVTIWMQSGTPQGVLVAKLSHDLGYEYEVKNITTKYSWAEMRAALPNTVPNKEHADVPQIFYGTTYVGGSFKDFTTYLNVDVTKLG